ncbi:MAG: hypothetical protein NUV80_05355 [Candidatus Berkelbacteria bacterium]|nr:hypothetical protein [Candidatus Berkelbacteria bacterium]
MNVDINFGILTIVGFAVAMIFAVVAILDLLGITKISAKMRATAPSLLVGAIGILVVPYFGAIGSSISKPWGDLLPMCFLPFIGCMVLINRRSQKVASHN